MKILKMTVYFMLFNGIFGVGHCADINDAIKKNVVKIFVSGRSANYYNPWQYYGQDSWTGSGFILKGGKILTNAHVVSNQVFMQVKKAGNTKKYTAKLEFVAHDTELALLKVDDPEFYSGSDGLEFGELPYQQDKLIVYGFPTGGDELSITEGIVSRIEVQKYVHSKRSFLCIQTDAAINPGNSGGPVIKDGKVVGVSFQSNMGSQNIGYAVPVMMTNRFFDDIADGKYDGAPELGIIAEYPENPAFRKFLGLGKDSMGIFIKKVLYGSSAFSIIKDGDVLLALDGITVDTDMTVPFRRSERIGLDHIVSMHQIGDVVKVKVLRDGKIIDLDLKLKKPAVLISGPHYDTKPSYYIYAGLVFTRLTRNFADAWGDWNKVPGSIKTYVDFSLPSAERREIVIVPTILADDINEGYNKWSNLIIEKVNGRIISTLSDVRDAIENNTGEFQIIETDSLTDSCGKIILNTKEAQKANEKILPRFSIASDRSDDLKP